MKQPQDYRPGRKKPMTKTVTIYSDNETVDRLEELRAELKNIDRKVASTKDEAEKATLLERSRDLMVQIAGLQQQVDEEKLVFKFQAIGVKAYDQLRSEWPPTDEQIAAARNDGEESVPFNPDEYPYRLIVACMVEPHINKEDQEEVDAFIAGLKGEGWNVAEVTELFMACVSINTTSRRKLGND